MSYENFPTIIPWAYTIKRIPIFDTSIINYGNKVEQRIANAAEPRYKIVANFSKDIIDSKADEIMAFFEARKGSFGAFYLQNPEESYRGTIWQANHVYIIGNIIRPVTANGRSYKCTVAGTSHSSAPTFPTTPNGTVVDNTVTWRENSYLVRFEIDELNAEYFQYSFYRLGEITFLEVSA
jgi:hypothetical protein